MCFFCFHGTEEAQLLLQAKRAPRAFKQNVEWAVSGFEQVGQRAAIEHASVSATKPQEAICAARAEYLREQADLHWGWVDERIVQAQAIANSRRWQQRRWRLRRGGRWRDKGRVRRARAWVRYVIGGNNVVTRHADVGHHGVTVAVGDAADSGVDRKAQAAEAGYVGDVDLPGLRIDLGQ